MYNEARKIKSFTDLDTWRESHKLVLDIYKITNNFPRHEIFGLVSQMRRSAVSITSNVAEGFSRQTSKEKIQFYYIAQGSVTELQNQLLIARDVGFISDILFNDAARKSVVSHKLINGLIKKLRIPNS